MQADSSFPLSLLQQSYCFYMYFLQNISTETYSPSDL